MRFARVTPGTAGGGGGATLAEVDRPDAEVGVPGETANARGSFRNAIGEYNQVLNNYPNSFKRADARLKKAYSLLKVHENGPAISELRRVIRENPGTEQARKAEARLRQLGVRAP